jgi:signal transduction histidine kinase
VAVLTEFVFFAIGPAELTTAGWPRTIVWSFACAAPIVLNRLSPWGAVALALASFAAATLHQHEPLTVVVTFILLTYSTAAHFSLRRAVLAATLLWVPLLGAAFAQPTQRDPIGVSTAYLLFTNVLIALVCFFIGRTVHARRASIMALEERARVAEENQRSLADQAVADERRRIARELHDVVAHHVSVMGVLATGARRVLARDPRIADEALGNIAETSRTTLREMRRLLDVLRTDAEPAADLTPQPGLAGIDSLVDQVREAGLPVSLRVDGVPTPLDPGLALTIFRIVQEALTNALKHAGTATAQVRLTFGVYWLIVEILDTGSGPSLDPNRVGHGLVGMRERVALYGGTLRTGPRPGGGFRVYAKMPMEHFGTLNSEETP